MFRTIGVLTTLGLVSVGIFTLTLAFTPDFERAGAQIRGSDIGVFVPYDPNVLASELDHQHKEQPVEAVDPVKEPKKEKKQVFNGETKLVRANGSWTASGIMSELKNQGADPAWIVDLTAVCLQESTVMDKADPLFNIPGNPNAIADKELMNDTWDASYGLCAIRALKDQTGTGGLRDKDKLLDPVFNLKSAVTIAKESEANGKHPLKPWTIWLNGKYRQRLVVSAAAAQRVFPEAETYWIARTQVSAHSADRWASMAQAAFLEEGLELAGWGWRSPEKQAQLRVDHCPSITSLDDPDMYKSVSCYPLTAIPGKSDHQRGKAIDFFYFDPNRGRYAGIGSNHPFFGWLDINACRFGYSKTVPSEPWHWADIALGSIC